MKKDAAVARAAAAGSLLAATLDDPADVVDPEEYTGGAFADLSDYLQGGGEGDGGEATGDTILEPGQGYTFVWTTMGDDRVRPAHADIDGELRTVNPGDDPPVWDMDGEEARYPGDPNLSPGLRINCRCWLDIVPNNDTSATLGDLIGASAAGAALVTIADLGGADDGSDTSLADAADSAAADAADIQPADIVPVAVAATVGGATVAATRSVIGSGPGRNGSKLRDLAEAFVAGAIVDAALHSGPSVDPTDAADQADEQGLLGSAGARLPSMSMSYTKDSNREGCVGVAVINGATGTLERCCADDVEANALIETLNASAEDINIDPNTGVPTILDSEHPERPVGGFNMTDTMAPPVQAQAPTRAQRPYEWSGPLVVQGAYSGDDRWIDRGALTYRDLPLPLMLQIQNPESGGHAGAVLCGSIGDIQLIGDEYIGFGWFDSGEAGQEAKRMLDEGTIRGVSADLDMVNVEYRSKMTELSDGSNDDAADALRRALGLADDATVMAVTSGRIMGATLTPFPVFQECSLHILTPEESALIASAGVPIEGRLGRWYTPWDGLPHTGISGMVVADTLVASAALAAPAGVPVAPPSEWFAKQTFRELTPVRIGLDGRVGGHVAAWGSCHIGFSDRCEPVPHSSSNYAAFRNKETLTAEGTLVATGPIYLDGGHAPLHLGAQGAKDWMADVCSGVADVAVYEDQFGIQIAGALRPSASDHQVRAFRGSDISPDWRPINGRREMVGLVAVNTSGFIVPGALVASAGAAAHVDMRTGEVGALVGFGMVTRSPLVARLTAVEREIRSALVGSFGEYTTRLAAAEQQVLAMKRDRLLAQFGVEPDCGCDHDDGLEAKRNALMARFSGGNCAPAEVVDATKAKKKVAEGAIGTFTITAADGTVIYDSGSGVPFEAVAGKLGLELAWERVDNDGPTYYAEVKYPGGMAAYVDAADGPDGDVIWFLNPIDGDEIDDDNPICWPAAQCVLTGARYDYVWLDDGNDDEDTIVSDETEDGGIMVGAPAGSMTTTSGKVVTYTAAAEQACNADHSELSSGSTCSFCGFTKD